jgi:hypothetical protein
MSMIGVPLIGSEKGHADADAVAMSIAKKVRAKKHGHMGNHLVGVGIR